MSNNNISATENTIILPYLIVGQGIAGSLLAWFLQKANQPFMIIDNGHQNASSKIAAGIINPITGRRFVKSWMIEELLPFAKETYLEIQAELGLDVWKELDIIRFFSNNAEGNNWLTKTTWEGYDKYLNKTSDELNLDKFIHDEAGYGGVRGAQVDLNIIITAFQKYFLNKGQLIQEQFDYSQLMIENNGISYKNIKAKKILFCEGYSAFKNPWFSHLPYESAKGEVLILRIPSLQITDIIKKHLFIVPIEKDLFWFGSNYEWDDLTEEPTEKGKKDLIEQLKGILKVDYEIVDHLAAVRPVLKDRRPVIGLHPEYPQIGILNGLGTKGTSIGPYWAAQMVNYLHKNETIEVEIDVKRFKIE